MPRQRERSSNAALRVTRHRRKQDLAGMKRVEVTVPAGDAALLRGLATRLRSGGKPAREARDGVRRLLRGKTAASGQALVAFFRASPLVGADLRFERDKSPGRPIDL